jgi:hypothetical protein
MSTDRYSFVAVVHARPEVVRAGPSLALRGAMSPTLDIAPQELPSFERTFEEVAAELERLPRLYFEPDGSIVWVSSDPADPWQLDGMLYDRAGHVLHMELKGTCPAAALDQVLTTLGRPYQNVIFQLVREAVFLDGEAFRRYAALAE